MRVKPYHYLLAAAWRSKTSLYTLAAKHSSLLKLVTKMYEPHNILPSMSSILSTGSQIGRPWPRQHYRRRVDAGDDAFFCTPSHNWIALGKF
jgi:hypothetical protein